MQVPSHLVERLLTRPFVCADGVDRRSHGRNDWSYSGTSGNARLRKERAVMKTIVRNIGS